MAYTDINFQSKKELKAAIASGKPVFVYQPGPFGPHVPDGEATLEGPHFPAPHTWYARVRVQDSKVVKVLS